MVSQGVFELSTKFVDNFVYKWALTRQNPDATRGPTICPIKMQRFKCPKINDLGDFAGKEKIFLI